MAANISYNIQIDHNIRSHEFFQYMNLWSDVRPPVDNKKYFEKKDEFNKNIKMDEMISHTLDCLSAISSFMDPKFQYLGNHYDSSKAKLF